jgi:uncharacterized protein
MKINVAQLRKAIGARQSFNFHSPAEKLASGDGNFWLHGLLEVSGDVINTGRFLAVTGIIGGTARLTCNRCLTDFTQDISVPFSETFREEGDDADPDALSFYGDEIDIAESVREALVIAEPLKALCREDCLGICPVCGVNRNENPCACDTAVLDPRLAALGKLLPRK